MKTIRLKRVMPRAKQEALGGRFAEPGDYDILIQEDANILKPDGTPLLMFRKAILPKALCKTVVSPIDFVEAMNDGTEQFVEEPERHRACSRREMQPAVSTEQATQDITTDPHSQSKPEERDAVTLRNIDGLRLFGFREMIGSKLPEPLLLRQGKANRQQEQLGDRTSAAGLGETFGSGKLGIIEPHIRNVRSLPTSQGKQLLTH